MNSQTLKLFRQDDGVLVPLTVIGEGPKYICGLVFGTTLVHVDWKTGISRDGKYKLDEEQAQIARTALTSWYERSSGTPAMCEVGRRILLGESCDGLFACRHEGCVCEELDDDT